MFLFDFFKRNKKTIKTAEAPTPEETLTLSLVDQPPFIVLSIEQAKEIHRAAASDTIWLDVRSPKEWKNGHVPGAKHIPIDDLEKRVSEIGPKDKKYIVYCHAGGRSTAACEFLNSQGYSLLFNMTGGMGEWNGPLET